jgi:hypothetical protein
MNLVSEIENVKKSSYSMIDGSFRIHNPSIIYIKYIIIAQFWRSVTIDGLSKHSNRN